MKIDLYTVYKVNKSYFLSFLEECEKQEIKWLSGYKPTELYDYYYTRNFPVYLKANYIGLSFYNKEIDNYVIYNNLKMNIE